MDDAPTLDGQDHATSGLVDVMESSAGSGGAVSQVQAGSLECRDRTEPVVLAPPTGSAKMSP